MRPPSPFRRGGFGDESSPPAPDLQHFTQVPAAFVQGLSLEQWKALQEIYRVAWDKANPSPPEAPNTFGQSNYDI